MTAQARSYYAIGAKVWYRQHAKAELRGGVEDITLGAPVTYCVRLESGESVWAAFSELLPR